VATDARQIVANLTAFYDFTGKAVIAVGAGGGQLAEYARTTRRVVAVDRDRAAIERLAARARECGLAERFIFVPRDFFEVRTPGDMVLFEFACTRWRSRRGPCAARTSWPRTSS
jgi:predicted RNA methylase